MPAESTFPPFEVPNVNIWEFVFENKERQFPDHQVIYVDVVTERTYTFGQVRETAITFGKGLKAVWEWRKNEVIALFTPNCIDTPAIIWGTHWAGGIVSPANPAYTADELAFQLKDSGAKALVTQKPLLDVARKAAKMVGMDEEMIILIGDDKDETVRFKHFTSIRNIAGTSRYRRTKVNPDKDLAFLVYSSGTTGHPKGVMLSHTNIVADIIMNQIGEEGNVGWKGEQDGHGEKVLAFLPFYHIYGLTCLIHQAMCSGWTLVVMAKFDLEAFCAAIQRHKIKFAYVVPPVVLLLSKNPIIDNYDFTSLRMMNSGAAPLTKELVDAVYKRLKIPVKQGYGLSETSPTTHLQKWGDWSEAIGSVGKLLPNQVAKYVNEEGVEVPAGEVGELWIKGPNIFKGYLNNEVGTKNALTDDNYFKTGDVGFQDKKGNFYITDRVKELIKYKGFQVPPAELEGLLASHPKIDDVAVIGLYIKDQATEVPRAYVVPAPGVEASPKTEKEIVDWLTSKVAAHKKLRGGVRFVDEIPKSASGKILRRMLKVKALEEEEKGLKAKL